MTAVVKTHCDLEVQDAVSPTIIDSFVIAANNFQLYHSTSTVQIVQTCYRNIVTSFFRFKNWKFSPQKKLLQVMLQYPSETSAKWSIYNHFDNYDPLVPNVHIIDKSFTILNDKIDDLIWAIRWPIPRDSHAQTNFDEFGRSSNFHYGTPNLTLTIPKFASKFCLVPSSGRLLITCQKWLFLIQTSWKIDLLIVCLTAPIVSIV